MACRAIFRREIVKFWWLPKGMVRLEGFFADVMTHLFLFSFLLKQIF